MPLNLYHRRICEELTKRGILWQDEYSIGQYSVDIFLPEYKRLVELDGPLHLSSKADRRREDEILEMRPELHFVRVKVGTPVLEAMGKILSV